ncbi:hypothetical protein C2W64_04118 [Brevibacillus laterosporus]|nr:hypothetical protein [Brevibacillus laterosporus]RAP29171.1 hypothetical protein C2W64_04118 [Brevibacillus laterosporus]
MQIIGRKIYFDRVTGNVLVDTGERAGAVRETTLEEDFQTYVALSERVTTTVDCLQLEYGQYSDNFSKGYSYHINAETGEIVWNLTPPQVEEREREKTLQEKVESLEKERQTLQLAVTQLYETNLSLEEKNQTNQLAITELYEQMKKIQGGQQ